MNKKNNLCTILLITGVLFMFNYSGCTKLNLNDYSSKDEMLNIKLKYPADWKIAETRGARSSYAQAHFLAPLPKGQKRSSGIIITTYPFTKVDLKPLTLTVKMEDLKAKRLKLNGAFIVSEKKFKIAGIEAREVILRYKLPEEFYKLNSKIIELQERAICLMYKNAFYYFAIIEELGNFNKINKIFNNMLKTVKFKK